MPTKSLASRTRKRPRRAPGAPPPELSDHERARETAIAVGRIAMGATVAAWLAYLVLTILGPYTAGAGVSIEAISFGIVVTFFGFSMLMYLLARQSSLRRAFRRTRPAHDEPDGRIAVNEGAMTVLLPSHAEDPGVVHAALWAAALREHPSTRVVLLLDDGPEPGDPAVAAQREAAGRIADALVEPQTRFADEMLIWEVGRAERDTVSLESVRELAQNYRWAAAWLADRGREEEAALADSSAVSEVLDSLRHAFEEVATSLDADAARGAVPSPERVLALHRRLLETFTASCETGERERFAAEWPRDQAGGTRAQTDSVS